MTKKRRPSRRVVWIVAALALLVASPFLALRAVAWWIDCGEAPVKSDILVALAGEYSRPAYAAELFAQGYAPDVWISRPERIPSHARLEKFGVHLPAEEEIDMKILLAAGVPEDRIHLYGHNASSTFEEAQALRADYAYAGKKILIVTSRFHVRRARMIFRRSLPGAEIHVVAEPYDAPQGDWWKDKDLAENAVLETLKTIYFLLGGRMS